MRQFVPAMAAVLAAVGSLVAAVCMRSRSSRRLVAGLAAWVLALAVIASLVGPPAVVTRRQAPALVAAGASPPVGVQQIEARAARQHQDDGVEAKAPTLRAPSRPAPVAALERKPATKRAAEPDTFLVAFAADVPVAEQREAVEEAGATVTDTIEALDTLVVSSAGGSRSSAATRLREDGRVERTEENLIRRASEDPDDEYLPYQPGVFTTRLPAAWDLTHGSTTIDIAILDTGVDLSHPDLAGRIVAGKNFVVSGGSVQDDEGHGTFVAGVAAAKTNNANGIAGAAWNARIIPVKVLDAQGGGDDGGIAAGIVWAADNGAEVINLSLGGPGSSQTLLSAIQYAGSKNVVVVAASGNEGSSVPSYPASYPQVFSVGATDEYGNVVHFSNRGPNLDVVAPGWGILSTLPSSVVADGYGVASGTSFSAPLVSGVAAMVKAKNPTFSASAVQQRLRSSAIDRGPSGIDDHYGWGLVDAYAAVGGRKAAPAPPSVRDAFEPDDTIDRARPIGDGATGTISPEGDDDWFYVDVPESGTLRVTVTPTASDDGALPQSFDPGVTAYDTDLEWRPMMNAQGPGGPETAVIAGDVAGRYAFHVRNVGTSRSAGTSTAPEPYTVSASFEPGPVTEGSSNWIWVRDFSPVPFGQGVPVTSKPRVTFTRDVVPASAEQAMALWDRTSGGLVSSTAQYDQATRVLTVTPAQNLVGGRTYEVVVAAGVVDAVSPTFTMPSTEASRFTVRAGAKPVDLRADFNKDGSEDTVIGASGEDHGTKTDGGVVHVLYGSGSGPQGSGSQMWSQDSSGIADAVEAGDRFGDAVATGDMNNDGYDDLVIGAPFEDVGAIKDAGMIHVLLGSSSGLRATGSSVWTTDTASVPGTSETGDRFGSTLAVGRFDANAGEDVAVGSPAERVGTQASAGAVHIFRGSAAGLTATGSTQWTQDSAGIDFFAEAGDRFGASLAAGDFQGDGNDDLAIGTPSDNVIGTDEGSVTLMRGSVVGMRPAGVTFDVFSDDGPEPGDAYGASVAIADLGGYGPTDGYADLVVGIPGESELLMSAVGNVDVVYSDHSDPWFSSTRIRAPSDNLLAAQESSSFGSSLAARTFGAVGSLAIGVPYGYATGGQVIRSGAALVYQTGSSLLSDGVFGPRGIRVVDQELPGLADRSEPHDRFALDVGLLDVDGDRKPDLVAGAPFESVGSHGAAGAVSVVRDAAGAAASSTLITQDTSGVGSAAEAGDRFGSSVS